MIYITDLARWEDKKNSYKIFIGLLWSTCTRKSNWPQILRLVSQDEPYWKVLFYIVEFVVIYTTIIY